MTEAEKIRVSTWCENQLDSAKSSKSPRISFTSGISIKRINGWEEVVTKFFTDAGCTVTSEKDSSPFPNSMTILMTVDLPTDTKEGVKFDPPIV